MDAFTYWKGPSFSLLEYLSLLSTSQNTGFEQISLYYDAQDHPDSHYWHLVDQIPRVVKRPAKQLLETYLARYLPGCPRPSGDVRILADIFRYAYLYDRGGAWFDLDTLQLKDLASLMAQRPFTMGWESEEWANIAIMASPIHAPNSFLNIATPAKRSTGRTPRRLLGDKGAHLMPPAIP